MFEYLKKILPSFEEDFIEDQGEKAMADAPRALGRVVFNTKADRQSGTDGLSAWMEEDNINSDPSDRTSGSGYAYHSFWDE
jgi:hypothetical protein